MTFSDLWTAFRFGFLPVVTFILGISLFALLAARYKSGIKFQGSAMAIVAFGSLGGVLGFAVGNSRQPIVGTVLPALLTFITALLGYLFSKEQLSEWRPVIPYCITVLVLNAFIGLCSGGIVRGKYEDFERDYQRRLMEYEKVDLEVKKAEQLKKIQSGD